MRSEDLQITALEGGFSITVSGRANFDYAVPLRDLSGKLVPGNWLQIDLENCEAMDSTFMGVLTMLALKMRKSGSQVMLLNANDNLQKLLRDLGILKLFRMVSEKENQGQGVALPAGGKASMLTTAETVAEAHRALVGADSANAERFKQVIEFADQDVERLINIYFEYYYGPAAKEMRKIFDYLRAGAMKHKDRQTSSVVGHWSYMTPEFLYESYAGMKKLASTLKQPWKQRVEDEMISFIWYALVKRSFYRPIFKQHGVDLDKTLPGECRVLVKKHISRFTAKDFRLINKEFEEAFKTADANLIRPEKFKNVPDEHFRMLAYPHFYQKAKSNALVVNDPDSIQGKALCSAHPDPARHGVNKTVSGNFKTTYFRWANHRVPGGVNLLLRQVPQDEKYHWFRMPGKLELKGISYFWGHAWAVQASTAHLYTLTDGNPKDNTWDEVWFSAKFTGPAYVKGSKKKNAIYVDMAVLVRHP